MKAPGSGWEVRAEPLLITDTRFRELINIQSRGQRGGGGGGKRDDGGGGGGSL